MSTTKTPATDAFTGYSRLALAAAILFAAASVGYRVAADHRAAAAAEAAQEAAAADQARQRQMMEGMVDQLEQKLRQEPTRVDGWLLLIRSRMSLGQADRAHAALDEAIKANPGAESEIRAQAKALGVE